LLEALGEAVVDGRALMGTLFEQHVERYRKLGPLRSTVGTASLVDTAKLVYHCATDAERGVRLERNAALRVVPIDGTDESDHRGGCDVITVSQRRLGDPHAAGNTDSEVRIALDERAA
jgi:hypothetical protein